MPSTDPLAYSEAGWQIMKLIVPFMGQPSPVDLKLIKLAEFLGIGCATLDLGGDAGLDHAIQSEGSCLVINPQVMRAWSVATKVPHEIVSMFLTRFPFIFVHGLRPTAFDSNLVSALSGNQLGPVQEVGPGDHSYQVATDTRDVCEAFVGTSFGPVDNLNDSVLYVQPQSTTARVLITIDGQPFLAYTKQQVATVFFIAGQDVADLDIEADKPLETFFSTLMPHAMALRYIFAEETWRPRGSYASLVIDDPLLREEYGFLNFDSLLCLMRQHNFFSTVAFIPHNFRRSLRSTVKLFRENQDRLALCFHGNDHTGAEFASTDTALLNTMLSVAEERMKVHRARTSLECDRVMVFPQGNFSEDAMRVLQARNFEGGVNTICHPLAQQSHLLLREMMQPSIRRYGGFPLFLRTSCSKVNAHDVAFNLFFGRPVFTVEHHDSFRQPQSVVRAVSLINSIEPGIHWSNLGEAFCNSALWRRAPDGMIHVRPYARSIKIANHGDVTLRIQMEWTADAELGSVERVLRDKTDSLQCESTKSEMHAVAELPPRSVHVFSLVYRNPYSKLRTLGFRRNARAFMRRRLSEIRDNYLSKNVHVLRMAEFLKSRLSRASGI